MQSCVLNGIQSPKSITLSTDDDYGHGNHSNTSRVSHHTSHITHHTSCTTLGEHINCGSCELQIRLHAGQKRKRTDLEARHNGSVLPSVGGRYIHALVFLLGRVSAAT